MTSLPRCSDGCGARITARRVANAARRQERGQAFSWRARECLAIHCRRLERIAKRNKKRGIVLDNEAQAVAMGLVPAPRPKRRSREVLAAKAPELAKRRTCDGCSLWRLCRPMGEPDARVYLCKECVP